MDIAEEYYEEITEMVHILHHSFYFYRSYGWKWISYKGLWLLLDIQSQHEKRLMKVALERLNVLHRKTSAANTLISTGTFYYMPEPKPHLAEKIEAIKKLIPPKQHPAKKCIVCGADFIPVSAREKICSDACRIQRRRYTDNLSRKRVNARKRALQRT